MGQNLKTMVVFSAVNRVLMFPRFGVWILMAFGLSACPASQTVAPARPTRVPPGATPPAAKPCPSPVEAQVEEDALTDAAEEEATAQESETPADPAWAEEWRRLTQEFPELARYGLPPNGLLTRLLDWAKPGETIAVYDRRCRPALVKRRQGALHGRVHRGFSLVPPALDEMSESYSEIQIGRRFDEYPSNAAHYRLNHKGIWVEDGSSGFGDARAVAHLLSAVTAEAAWFDDASISIRIGCTRLLDEESGCAQGGRRTCQRCEAWGPLPQSQESSFGMNRTLSKRRIKAKSQTDCSVPCAAIAEPPNVARANATLLNREFRLSIAADPKPLVFRTEAACRAYTKKHTFSADEVEIWSGHPQSDPE